VKERRCKKNCLANFLGIIEEFRKKEFGLYRWTKRSLSLIFLEDFWGADINTYNNRDVIFPIFEELITPQNI